MKAIATIFICGVSLASIFGLGWVLTGNELAMTRFFAPKYEAVRRQTFEESKAYREGMIQELRSMQFSYEQADSAHKAALAQIIRHRAADFQDMPADLQFFINHIQH